MMGQIIFKIYNHFSGERGRLNGLMPVEGATQAPVIAEMLQMANNVRR